MKELPSRSSCPQSKTTMAKILVLDDDQQIRRAIELHLVKDGHDVVSCANGKEGLAFLTRGNFDMLLTDLQMPELNGIELLRKIKDKNLSIPTIVLTGFASVETAVEAMKLGAADYITKPPQLTEISLKVANLLAHQALAAENLRLKSELKSKFEFDGIIGKSPAMLSMFEKLKPLSRDGNISILLTGESGTGKELTAKAIHYNSPRADQPYVAINCGALPEHLFESELFGHEKGAFTDAKETKKGLFETANRGTLFLDEISAMPQAMQVKLLRAIEEREIRRVGGTKEIPLDVRFIAASNQDLEKLVDEGKFRHDLYYRLAVAPVNIPRLRERAGDVRILTQHFLRRIGEEKNREVRIDAKAIEVLEQYSWKGNVRELENLIELLVVTASGEISASDLPNNITSEAREIHLRETPSRGSDLKTATKNVTDRFEREFITQHLVENHWNISKTADVIGISRGALHTKMKRYEIDK